MWLGKTNPSQSMDTSTPGILESRSSRMAALIDDSSTKPMQSEDASTCLPQSLIMRGEEENLNVRTPRCPRRRGVKPRSGDASSADTECDPTLLDDVARDLEADVIQRDSSSWSMIPVRSQAVIAVPRPPGTFFSGRFAVLADGDQHDDTPVDPIWPTEPDANSIAVDSIRQESDTESVLSEGMSEVPESVETVGNPSEVVESEFETPVPVPASTWDLYHWTLSTCVMKAPPAFFRGAYRSAMRVALQEIVSGMSWTT